MQIRPADEADLDTVSALRVAFVAEVRGVDTTSLPMTFVSATRDSHRRCFAAGRLRSWLAIDGETMLGVVSLLVDEVPPRPEDERHLQAFVLNLFVQPPHRGRGIGRHLMEACLDDARTTGVRLLGLHTTADGRPLYEALGFRTQESWLELAVQDER